MVRAHLAHVLLAQGRDGDAVAMVDSSLALGAGSGSALRGVLANARAKALVRTEDGAAEAIRLDREAVEIVAGTDRLNLHAEALAMLGDVLAASGDRAAAITALDDARRLYERKGNPLLAERTREASTRLAEGLETAS